MVGKDGPVNNPEATDSFINLFDGVSAFSVGTAIFLFHSSILSKWCLLREQNWLISSFAYLRAPVLYVG
jgi:hypothetical protein